MDDDSFCQISVSPHGNSFGNWQQFSLFNQISYSKRTSAPSIHLSVPRSYLRLEECSHLYQIKIIQPVVSRPGSLLFPLTVRILRSHFGRTHDRLQSLMTGYDVIQTCVIVL